MRTRATGAEAVHAVQHKKDVHIMASHPSGINLHHHASSNVQSITRCQLRLAHCATVAGPTTSML
jgi:hypothetical protein